MYRTIQIKNRKRGLFDIVTLDNDDFIQGHQKLGVHLGSISDTIQVISSALSQ